MFDVVGLSAFKGSGKTTLAKHLEKKGFHRVSFADPIREMLEFQNPYLLSEEGAKPLQEILLHQSWQDLKTTEYSEQIRNLMISTGNALRSLDESLIIRVAHDRVCELLDGGDKVVIDDVRLPSEAQFVRELGGVVIRINRPTSTGGGELEDQDFKADFTINNDGTLGNLYEQADRVLS